MKFEDYLGIDQEVVYDTVILDGPGEVNTLGTEGYEVKAVYVVDRLCRIVMQRPHLRKRKAPEPAEAEQHFAVRPRFHIGQLVTIRNHPEARWTVAELFAGPLSGELTARLIGPWPSGKDEFYFTVVNLEPADES